MLTKLCNGDTVSKWPQTYLSVFVELFHVTYQHTVMPLLMCLWQANICQVYCLLYCKSTVISLQFLINKQVYDLHCGPSREHQDLSTFYITCQISSSTCLTKHRQFFGKVHHSGYGRGDNFCKLTEGFYIHFVSFRGIDHGCLTNFLRLKQQGEKVSVWTVSMLNKNKKASWNFSIIKNNLEKSS